MTTATVEITKGPTDMLLSFQTFFWFPGPSFHISEFSLPRFWERYVPRELLYLLQVLFYSVFDRRSIRSAAIYRRISNDRPVPI